MIGSHGRYNTTFHAAIKTTPFRVVFGREPPPLISYGDRRTPNNTLDQQLIERDRLRGIGCWKRLELWHIVFNYHLRPRFTMYLCFTMKRKVGEQKVIQLQLPELSNEFEMQGQPEVILGRRWNPTVGKEEVLVKWTN